MLKTGEIIFNNQSSLDLNLRMEEYPVIDMLQQDYEQVDVIGRNGSIFINKGSYRNRTAQCNLEIFTYDYNDTYEKVLDWLYNIEDDRLLIDSDYKCYRVEKVELTTTQNNFKNVALFQLILSVNLLELLTNILSFLILLLIIKSIIMVILKLH